MRSGSSTTQHSKKSRPLGETHQPYIQQRVGREINSQPTLITNHTSNSLKDHSHGSTRKQMTSATIAGTSQPRPTTPEGDYQNPDATTAMAFDQSTDKNQFTSYDEMKQTQELIITQC